MEVSRRATAVCERIPAYVSLEVDGELSEFEREFLSTHLLRCGDCRVYRSEIHALAKHIRDTPAEVPARSVRVPVHVSSGPTARLTRYQLGAAAALAVAVVGTASLVTPSVDREQANPFHQENVPSQLRDPTVVFSGGELRGYGLTPGPSALTRRGPGFDLVL